MSGLLLFAALLTASAVPSFQSSKVSFYIGVYTAPGGSEGIYRSTLDERSGKISAPTLAVAAENPSYLAQSADGSVVYAVHENDHGSVSAYRREPDGRLTLLNSRELMGGAPCDLSVDPQGRNLLVASYTGGYVACLPIRPDGSLAVPTVQLKNEGHGPNSARQESSHMHWIQADARCRFVYSCDLGTDKVQVYRYQPGEGAMKEQPNSLGSAPPGAGPRHGAFNASGTILYVNNEMGNSVSAYGVTRSTGALKLMRTESTLTPEALSKASATHQLTTAEIELHPSGKWLYVSNRGDDSITRFVVGPGGVPADPEVTRLGMKMPRGFAISRSGKWLVVGGQDSHDLASYSIDPGTGRLAAVSRLSGIERPVCILFTPR